MNISLVIAVAENGVIGKDNQLLWKLSSDLKRFKQITTGHFILLGRKTFESIGKPLPNRTNIIISRNPSLHDISIYQTEDVTVVYSLDEALEKALQGPQGKHSEVFIIGGGQIYAQAIEKADKLYLTLVEGDFSCDTFFPDYSEFINENFIGAGEENGIRYKFLELNK